MSWNFFGDHPNCGMFFGNPQTMERFGDPPNCGKILGNPQIVESFQEATELWKVFGSPLDEWGSPNDRVLGVLLRFSFWNLGSKPKWESFQEIASKFLRSLVFLCSFFFGGGGGLDGRVFKDYLHVGWLSSCCNSQSGFMPVPTVVGVYISSVINSWMSNVSVLCQDYACSAVASLLTGLLSQQFLSLG